jgi:hypothetical protein
VDFTREPIIETIITPKEGYKLVIRSSKSAGQEEHFVDAVEVVAFGHALFFRSLERPKAFLVPVSDYEILEVREARMVLKNVGLDRSIKIGGGREGALKATREVEKGEVAVVAEEAEQEETPPAEISAEGRSEIRVDKKRDRRRHYRKRRGRDENAKEEAAVEPAVPALEDEKISISPPQESVETISQEGNVAPSLLSSLLQPPPTLISETINRYRQNELFKGAFYLTEEEQYKPHDKVQELLNEDDEDMLPPPLLEPSFASEETPEQLCQQIVDEEKVIKEEKEELDDKGEDSDRLIENQEMNFPSAQEEQPDELDSESEPSLEEEGPANSNPHAFQPEEKESNHLN